MTTFVLSIIDANLLVEFTLENQFVKGGYPIAYIHTRLYLHLSHVVYFNCNNNLVVEYKCILWLHVQPIVKHPSSHLDQIKLNPNYKRCFT